MPSARSVAIRELVREYIDILQRRGVRSRTGAMLEAAASIPERYRHTDESAMKVRDDSRLWNQWASAERQHQRYAFIVLVMASLDEHQRRAVMLCELPIGVQEYQRIVPNHELEERQRPGEPLTKMTRLDEEYVCDAAMEGFSVVRGEKPLYPRREDVARRMGMSPAALNNLLYAAYDAIRSRLHDSDGTGPRTFAIELLGEELKEILSGL